MNDIDKQISSLIGTEDLSIYKLVKDIKNESKNFNDFKDKITYQNIIVPPASLNKLYILLSLETERNVTSKFEENIFNIDEEINNIIKTELKLGDSSDIKLIKDFISDILENSKDWSEFRQKIIEMETGLNALAILRIYDLFNKNRKKDRLKFEDNNQQLNTETIKIKKEEDEEIDYGLNLPNEKVDWNKLSDLSDLVKDEDIAPKIEEVTENSPILHKIYSGIIKRIMPFGCFVELQGFKSNRKIDGLVHVSEISNDVKVNNPDDIVMVNEKVYVQIIKLHPNGKISLSMKNVDQLKGTIINDDLNRDNTNNSRFNVEEEQRGRSTANNKFNIRKRKLTSPERWEIKQLIASGAASIKDYPELNESNADNSNTGNSSDTETEPTDENMDVELNLDDKPVFLQNAKELGAKRYAMPKIVKIPRSSMNRVAMNGSHIMKEHREEKFQKKKDIEQKIRTKKTVDDPTKAPSKVKEEIEFLRKQLVVTAWERNRMKEHVNFGKRTSLPMTEQRSSLPVYKMRKELINAVRDNQFLVIVGETGSGKTTQITQYLDEEGFSNNGVIGCTQPRRVAAVSVAKRVAEEVGCRLGEDVGYTIRFEDKSSERTRIKYMTDGMLQVEALRDPLMSKYSVIMLDEAHERTIATDVLFALLKQTVAKRPDLKVIITSATLNSAKFSEYFMNCPIINIPGKTFPVEVLYSQSPQMDYIEAALDCVMDIHINNDKGDILVFLTGQEEIDSCCEILYERVKTLGDAIDELIILSVYSALPSEIQSKIFEPTPEGSRKVVFATNIAETSITIDGIYYVVDPGFAKINTYNPRAGMEQLVVCPISQAQANQRKGRAGRTGPGKCYRLYTESAFYNEMLQNSVPEIQRQNLSHTILMLKAMGINDLLNFDFMDPPPKNLMLHALTELFNLEAIDTEGFLTKLGQRMSQFPMDPTLSRTLLSSVTHNCSDEIIIIIAMLTVQSVFYRPKNRQQEADQKKVKFHHPYGDHLTLLNVFIRWEQSSYSDQFCDLNFLHARHLRKARDVRNQLLTIFKRYKIPVIKSHGDPDLIRKALVSGFFMNAAKRDSQVGYKTILGNTIVGVHPSSALYGKEYDYVIYHSLVLTSREYMSQVTSIDASWLVELAPHFYKPTTADSKTRKRAKIVPLHNKFSQNQNSWRLSSIRQSREKALGIKR